MQHARGSLVSLPIYYLYGGLSWGPSKGNTDKRNMGLVTSPRASKISCLLFTYAFTKTNLKSCQNLSLNKLCESSGQLINFYKSSLTLSNNATAHDK